MTLEKLLKDVKSVATICFQWGDTGKGKIAHALAEWADVNARGTGGNNAGHTFHHNGKEIITHFIPVGIAYDSLEKKTILGNGMVINVEGLCGEIDYLAEHGIQCNNLMVSEDAHVILPYHIKEDVMKNQSQKKGGIGSTGRGIGPTYRDKVERTGIMIRDLSNPDVLKEKIEKGLTEFMIRRNGRFLKKVCDNNYGISTEEIIVEHKNLGREISVWEAADLSLNGGYSLNMYYKHLATQKINVKDETERIIENLRPFAERIRPFVRDTISDIHQLVREGNKSDLLPTA